MKETVEEHDPPEMRYLLNRRKLLEMLDTAVATERERILKLLKAQSRRYFDVGSTHSSLDVRQAAMETAAGWNMAINLIEQDAGSRDEAVVVEAKRG